MKFLAQPPRFLFFTGKGGVGKTSIACATAVQLADVGKRVLLVSTDPASNVGQVFGVTIGNRVTAISEVSGLAALEIDPQAAAAEYRERIVGPVRGVLPETVVKGIEEQLSGACTTEIAAFDEFTGLLTDGPVAAEFDHIIFDTAPTGHTIRLLQLPGAWSGFLEEGKGDASCLGPLAGLEKQRDRYREAVQSLADPRRTRLILVARAQQSCLAEVARTREELAKVGMSEPYLVVNGLMPKSEESIDPLAAAIREREQRALAALPELLKGLPYDEVPLRHFNIMGVEVLRRLLTHIAARDVIAMSAPIEFEAPALSALVDKIAADQHGLVMLMGKGGVGKTTLAAAIALELAGRGFPVHLTTSDPAAHLSETLNGLVDNLTVSRIDPQLEIEKYREHVLRTEGSKLDSDGRALLEEDLRSPCTEEIAVFQAFSAIIRESTKKFVVMDTAPTGHTLLLLDATGAYHREITRQLSEKSMHVTTPMMRLQDEKQTKIILVTMGETTPVLEAANLQADLRRAGIEPWAWIINNCIAAGHPTSPLLRQRALNELSEIDTVAKLHARQYAAVPLLKEEPVGSARLLRLSCTEEPIET